jgi:hypothetical protein
VNFAIYWHVDARWHAVVTEWESAALSLPGPGAFAQALQAVQVVAHDRSQDAAVTDVLEPRAQGATSRRGGVGKRVGDGGDVGGRGDEQDADAVDARPPQSNPVASRDPRAVTTNDLLRFGDQYRESTPARPLHCRFEIENSWATAAGIPCKHLTFRAVN